MPSDHEGLPMAALESLALRIPLIAHAVGGLKPLLQGAWPKGLVEIHSADGYSAAVLASLELIKTGEEPILPASFTASENANDVVELYRSLLAERSI